MLLLKTKNVTKICNMRIAEDKKHDKTCAVNIVAEDKRCDETCIFDNSHTTNFCHVSCFQQ